MTVRDRFEARIPEFQTRIADLVGLDNRVTLEYDIRQLYSYCKTQERKEEFGDSLALYFQSLINAMDGLINRRDGSIDQEARSDIQKAFSDHVVCLEPDEDMELCGIAFKNGRLHLLFQPEYFGREFQNISYYKKLLLPLDTGKA